MEIAQEVRVILQDEQHDANSADVESFHSFRRLLSWEHIMLQEGKATHEQVFDLEPRLILLGVHSLDKVRHE